VPSPAKPGQIRGVHLDTLWDDAGNGYRRTHNGHRLQVKYEGGFFYIYLDDVRGELNYRSLEQAKEKALVAGAQGALPSRAGSRPKSRRLA